MPAKITTRSLSTPILRVSAKEWWCRRHHHYVARHAKVSLEGRIRVSARPHRERARLDHATHRTIVHREIVGAEHEAQLTRLARIQRDSPESAQLAHGARDGGGVVAEIQLRHLGAGAGAVVRHIDGDDDAVRAANVVARTLAAAERDPRIREAVAAAVALL